MKQYPSKFAAASDIRREKSCIKSMAECHTEPLNLASVQLFRHSIRRWKPWTLLLLPKTLFELLSFGVDYLGGKLPGFPALLSEEIENKRHCLLPRTFLWICLSFFRNLEITIFYSMFDHPPDDEFLAVFPWMKLGSVIVCVEIYQLVPGRLWICGL